MIKSIVSHRNSLFLLTVAVSFLMTSCATPPSIGYRPPAVEIAGPETIAGPFPVAVLRGGHYHAVAPGETLWRISKMYDVDAGEIQRINKIRDVTDIDIGKRLFIPGAVARKDVITLYPSRKWRYIIIHHSATDSGNCEWFDKAHKNKGWQGVGYHFVIDNGTCGKDDGQIESTPRWIKQQDGAHCKADSMNERGIGICLVGNFSVEQVTKRQLKALEYLVNQLKKYYKIPNDHIIGHGLVHGANTECPGRKFPWKTFYSHLQ